MDLTQQEIKTLQYIRNYVSHTGHAPSLRKLMSFLGYKSPRSSSLVFRSLITKGYLGRNERGEYFITKDIPIENENFNTVDVPIVGKIAAGVPILAEQNIEDFISVSTALARPPFKYFILRVKGKSMNLKKIFDGSLVLIRHQSTANSGDIICAVLNGEATLKEFIRKENFIILKPHSTEEVHKPVILTENFQIQGVFVTTIPEFQ